MTKRQGFHLNRCIDQLVRTEQAARFAFDAGDASESLPRHFIERIRRLKFEALGCLKQVEQFKKESKAIVDES